MRAGCWAEYGILNGVRLYQVSLGLGYTAMSIEVSYASASQYFPMGPSDVISGLKRRKNFRICSDSYVGSYAVDAWGGVSE